MSRLELAAVVVSYGALLACGIGLIVFTVIEAVAPPGSRRRRR